MNTTKFLNSFPIDGSTFAADMTSLRTKFFDNGICWTDDIKGQFVPGKSFRVILYTRNTQVDFKNPMSRECNGLVFEYDGEWKLLAMPQSAFCTNKVSMKKINDIYVSGGYDVYEVLDATILTLYYYRGSWRVSSTKGYDVGPTEMVNGMTFMGAIEDLMESKYKAFRFEDLNKEFSYTIALRHSNYHIFDETKHLANRTKHVPKPGVDMNSYIMVMCVADVAAGTYMAKNVPGLPQQNPLAIREGNIHALISYARSAYAKYAKAHRLQNFKYKPLYGYILRAKQRSVPDDYSTIYIESELYKLIKIGLYKDNSSVINGDYDKLVAQMTMNRGKHEQFQIVFQQFEDKFKLLESNVGQLTTEVSRRIVSDEPMIIDQSNQEVDELEKMIGDLVIRFKAEPDITPGIIKDALYGKEYAKYLHLLSA